MTINDWLGATTNKFSSAGIESARLDSQIILEHVLGITRESLLSRPDFELSNDDVVRLNSLIERRLKLEPVAYLTGTRQFYGLDFDVNSSVLVPRPETEKLVEYIIDTAREKTRILDVGTGSGVIAISLKKNRDDLEVSASEISESALKVARANAGKHDVFIGFIKSDLFSEIRALKQYDIVAANLPYVSLDKLSEQSELKHEPAIALFSDEGDGLNLYRKFFREVDQYLVPVTGYIVIEHDPVQFETLVRIAKDVSLTAELISPFITKFSPIPVRTISIN